MSRSSSEIELESVDRESHIESLHVKIDYYRSFEYHVDPMSTRCSTRRHKSKEGHNGGSSPDTGLIQRKRRTREKQSRMEAGQSIADGNEPKERDLIDIIRYEKYPYEVDEGDSAEISGKGLDDSDSSITSGPSSIHPSDNNRWRSRPGFCSACQKLYRRAVMMTSPILDKLLDNDPNSLTCDQWVLKKEWRPRRLPTVRGKLLTHVELVKRRLRAGAQLNLRESSACLRPHTFLQRNLQRCAAKNKRQKKKWRKRSAGYSQGSAITKKRRLHGNKRRLSSRPARDTNDTDSDGSLSLERLCNQKRQEDRHRNAEVSMSPVALETSTQQDPASVEKVPKKKIGFLGRLAQLRGNSSMIIRETR